MSTYQKNAMYDLYMSGTNRDSHTWVTWGAVEDTVADLLQNNVELPQWHKSKITRPKYGETVLCYVPKCRRIVIDTYYGRPYWTDEVSHWMELPRIPLEEMK